jgi:hypothetical protein
MNRLPVRVTAIRALRRSGDILIDYHFIVAGVPKAGHFTVETADEIPEALDLEMTKQYSRITGSPLEVLTR